MKALVLMLLWVFGITAMLTSCTNISHPLYGSYTSVGGDLDGLRVGPDGFSFDSNRNSPAFIATLEKVEKAWKSYVTYLGLKFVAGEYFDWQNNKVDSAVTEQLEKARLATSVETAKIEADKAVELAKLPPAS